MMVGRRLGCGLRFSPILGTASRCLLRMKTLETDRLYRSIAAVKDFSRVTKSRDNAEEKGLQDRMRCRPLRAAGSRQNGK